MSDRKPFYVSTAISYTNGPPHIGHAYELIATDVMARFHRLDGFDVRFLTGTDEHGSKVEQAAWAEGLTAREFCNQLAPLFQRMTERLNASNDDFIRTTEERHIRSSQAIWQAMKGNGDIYLDNYAGWYSVRDEAYYAEDELVVVAGEGGEKLSPQGTPVEWVEEPSYFFRLSKYQRPLLEHYQRHPGFIRPETRRNEVMSFVRGGLRDLSVSRTTFKWGVPVPDDADHVMYVWVDALTNYITGMGYPDTEAADWQRYWPADIHVIGKDIVRFHAVYWPAFLMSAGIELPGRVFAHGFLNVRGEKMSKSVGNVVDPFDLAEAYGVDQVRYFFMREVPFGQDGSYSPESMVSRINADLANDFGNLAQRVLSMIHKNCEGRLPQPGDLAPADETLLAAVSGQLEEIRRLMQDQAIHRMLEAIWRGVGEANRYVDEQAPWALRKSDPARMQTVLYVLAEAIRNLAIMALSVVPEGAGRMLDQLAVAPEVRNFAALGQGGALQPGSQLPKPEPVFPRHVEAEAES